jgi:CheY-like chemotaxis protein
MRKILVAEGDHDICTLLQALLTDEGFQVTLAHNGAKALEMLKREGGWVLFLDPMMPQITGQEVLLQVQQHPTLLAGTRVMVMSSSWQLTVEATTWPRHVVADVLPKPFELEHVLALARQLTVQVP